MRSNLGPLLLLPPLLLALASCGSDTAAFPPGEAIDLVYISDSGGWGVAERYADLAAEALDREVRVHDHATGGLSAARALQMIQGSLADEVATAEIVVVYGNPEGSGVDFRQPDIGTCVTTSRTERQAPVIATEQEWQPYRGLMDDIYREIWKLRENRPTILRAVDLYAPVISDWRAAGIEAECIANWETWSRVLEAAAEANGAVFVSPFDILNGPNHDEDPREKGWILDDGQHTTAEGAAAIADALAAAGFQVSDPPG